MRRAATSALLFLSSACGEVLGLSNDRAPLAQVHVEITGDLPAVAAGSTGPLRAGLVWAGVPVFVPYCYNHGPTPLDPGRHISEVARRGCRNPFEVVPAAAGPSVPITADTTSFDLPLPALPDAEVMVGTLGARVAYASVVIFEDRDNNGHLDLTRGCSVFGRSSTVGPESTDRDRLFAASFVSLEQPQIRVAYVEGPFNADSFFYPHPACAALPPPGFSIWEVGGLLGPGASCSVFGLDHPVVVEAAPAQTLRNLTCAESLNESFPRAPRNNPFATLSFECTEDGSVATTDTRCACPRVRVLGLVGCFDDLACPNPDWDLRANPPEWWPCPIPDPRGT